MTAFLSIFRYTTILTVVASVLFVAHPFIQQKVPSSTDWADFITRQPLYYDAPAIYQAEGITVFKPTDKMLWKDVEKSLGRAAKTIRVVKQTTDGEDRPLVMTLHIYDKMVFVESDFEAIPGTIVWILVK